jgi:lysophospholipase L1-like esterase
MLLAGSSHTRLFSPYVRERLQGEALVETLPFDAGRTDEILASLPQWPVEDKDLIHLYAGLRDLALDGRDLPFVGPEDFRGNLKRIVAELRSRSRAAIVLSNVPVVSEGLLEYDAGWNERIGLYNRIIEAVAGEAGVPVHDFRGFADAYGGERYLDGLHFTRGFYRDFGRKLAEDLMGILRR